MIEQLSVQTRFKHPCKRSSNGLATHIPYNPRGRLMTPEASERPSGLCADAEVGRQFHLSARPTWNQPAASLRTESLLLAGASAPEGHLASGWSLE
jgi:hypothetical protein